VDEPHEAFSKIVAILLTEWRRAYQPAADYKSVDNEQIEKNRSSKECQKTPLRVPSF
jgi:hypothetical protein